MKPIKLSRAPGWDGWVISPYGNCREWRLIAPDGTAFTMQEVAEIRAAQYDIEWLVARVRSLEATLAPGYVAFAPQEFERLAEAVQVLVRAVPLAPASRATPAECEAGEAIVHRLEIPLRADTAGGKGR